MDSRGRVDAERPALVLDDLRHPLRERLGLRRVVLGRVGDAEAAAEVHLGHHDVELGRDPRVQGEHPAGRDLEAGGVEDLAADVGVQAEQPQARRGQHAAYGLERVAAGDREAELLVLVGGGDVLVGVRLDAGGDAHEHARGPPELGGHRRQPLDLVEGVDDDPADAELDGPLELAERLVVAVEADPLHREARARGHRQLAAGADVEREPVLGQPARHGRAEERLAGVEDLVAGEGVAEGAGPGAEVVLVEDVGR